MTKRAKTNHTVVNIDATFDNELQRYVAFEVLTDFIAEWVKNYKITADIRYSRIPTSLVFLVRPKYRLNKTKSNRRRRKVN